MINYLNCIKTSTYIKLNPETMFKTKLSFIVFLFFYLCYQFFSLNLQPIPWFDETFFASITHNFWREGSFVPEIAATVLNHKPLLIYGPIYFIVNSFSFQL